MERLVINEIRGDAIEAVHNVDAIVYRNGQIELSVGNTNWVIPMRSTAKPFMLCPLLNTCNQNGITLNDEYISIIASSHNGEAIHRKTVTSLLEMSNSDISEMVCGTHLPYFEWLYKEYFDEHNIQKRQLFHNCSAKHAGMLLLAELNGFPKSNYWEQEHPVQKAIIKSIKKVMRLVDRDTFLIAKDGCGVPTYCVTLKQLAKAYQLLFKDDPLHPVAMAIMAKPYFVAGKNRIETDIIVHCGFIAKSGSSGLFAISCPKENISIALKVEDGNDDAAESAAVEILHKLGLIDEKQQLFLEKYRTLQICTSTNQIAGVYSPRWING